MIKITKETVNSGVPVFQSVFETAQGGFTLDVSALPEGGTVPAGSLMGFDESTRKAKVIKTATVYENVGGGGTAIKVKKGQIFKVGDYVAATIGGAAYSISSIDTSNADYDTLNVSTTLGAIVAGNAVFQSSVTGGTSAAFPLAPKGLLYEDTTVETNADVAVVIRGTVYARRAPAIPSEAKTLLPTLIFSQSY